MSETKALINRSNGKRNSNNNDTTNTAADPSHTKENNNNGPSSRHSSIVSATAATGAAGTLATCKASLNVPLLFTYNFWDGASFSVWQAQILPVIVYEIAHNNSFVGYVSGANGVGQVVAAFVAGYTADILPKKVVCRCAALCGLLAAITMIYGVWANYYFLFVIANAIWGVYKGLANPSTESMFADSVEDGRRTDIYSKKYIVQMMSYLIGYIVNIILFVRFGQSWALDVMQEVMYVGLAIHPLAFIPLATLNDKYALTAEEKHHGSQRTTPAPSQPPEVTDAEAREAPDTRTTATPTAAENALLHDEATTPADNGTEQTGAQEVDEQTTVVAVQNVGETHRQSELFVVDEPDTVADSSKKKKSPLEELKEELYQEKIARQSAGKFTDSDFEEEEELEKEEQEQRASPPPSKTVDNNNSNEEEESPLRRFREARRAAYHEYKQTTSPAYRLLHRGYRKLFHNYHVVPYLCVAADLIQSFGSGMTLRFIALFFVSNYNVKPITMVLFQCGVTVLAACLAQSMNVLSKRLQRVPLMIFVRLSGTILLTLMAGGNQATGSVLDHIRPQLGIFLVRQALMNCSMGMSRSLLMDVASKENRSKWTAMESFASFSWAGSAVVGGWIADAKGYTATFFVTAGVHYFSILLLLPAAFSAYRLEKIVGRRTLPTKK